MIIEENKNKKIIIVAIICLLVIAAVIFGSWQVQQIRKKALDEEVAKKASYNSPRSLSYEKKSKAIVSADELSKIKGKSIQEITDYLTAEKGKCEETYDGIANFDAVAMSQAIPDMFRMNPFETEKYLTCSAIKNGKIEECQKIPDPLVETHCEFQFKLFKDSVLPAMRSGQCLPEYVQACKDSDKEDCENLCSALVNAKTEQSCADFQNGSLARSICLAVNKKDFAACDDQKGKFTPSPQDPTVGEDIWYECVQLSYFVRAVRENNPDLLEEISRRNQYPIYKLFFDQNFDCRSILDTGKVRCDMYYDNNRLKVLEDAAKS